MKRSKRQFEIVLSRTRNEKPEAYCILVNPAGRVKRLSHFVNYEWTKTNYGVEKCPYTPTELLAILTHPLSVQDDAWKFERCSEIG